MAKKSKVKVISTENPDLDHHYYIEIRCPYCETKNLLDGDNTMGGPAADALKCYKCDKVAWLGGETEMDYEGDLGEAYVQCGYEAPTK